MPLTLADAQRIAAAAAAEATRNAWKVTIAVVDGGGHLLCLQREHDTQFGSIELAIKKAHAAVAFQRPTKVSEDAVQNGRLIHLALPGVIPSDGGFPLLRDGRIVGGIGVSGVSAAQDGQIAQAGVGAL